MQRGRRVIHLVASSPWRIGVAAGTGVVALAAATGLAIGAIPDSAGVIHGCYTKTGGKLSVIDTEAGKSCKKNQISLNWNQTGPQGPPGQTGLPGPTGPSPFAGYADGGNQQPVNCPPNGQPISWGLIPPATAPDPPLVRSVQFNIGSPTGIIIDVFGDPGTYHFQLLCSTGGYLSGSYVIP
jgi:hypothetical protein